MKRYAFFTVILLIGFSACKQTKTAKTDPTPTIATIGDQSVPTSEFAYVYQKNNANAEDAYTQASINEYLKLYLNFKLKVREAEALGLDTVVAFKKELDGYKKQLAQPYFIEKNVTDRLTKEAYERMKEEINASHILVKLNQDADPKDTLAAYNRIMDIRSKALKGESFEQLAQQYSDDPSSKTNKGNLGFFTAFGTIYAFESAAYNTPVGTISNPVRTQFGYHLVKVNKKRPSQGQVRVSHLMVRTIEGQSQNDSIATKQKIDELYSRLKKGEDWGQLVSQFSDDGTSKNKGGELAWFSAGKMIPTFEDAAFALNQPGDISEPTLTPYGWHIIKLLERKPLESFETLEPTLKSKVTKDRGEVNKKALIERLRKENSFSENTKAVDAAIAAADSSLTKGTWDYKANSNNPELFTIGKQKYTQNEFFQYVKQKQRPKKNISANQYIKNLYKEYVDEKLISYEESHLEEKYPDYKMLVKEYRDGILLFQLMDERVWSKAIEDTAGLKKFFISQSDKYKWDSRATAKIFNAANPETIDKLKTELAKGKFLVKDMPTQEISFSSKKYNLSEEDKSKLTSVNYSLFDNKTYTAEITSSSDYLEGEEFAAKRAQAAKAFLKELGADSTRLTFKTKVGSKAEKNKAADRKLTIRTYTTSIKELEKQFNANAPLTLQVSEGIYQKADNPILSDIEWKEGTYTVSKDGRTYYILISKIEAPRPKTFEESRGLAISDYQNFLEQEWLGSLNKKYPVKITETEIQKVTKP